ncbi:O-fucosyltransferase family protein [Komagataeibacter xylinus]|uniref:O-fucosyltransferase family protein n=1 Tax=Komagataeibacter xylinus TaxID=28448 RepID=UPI001013D4E8|nr:O-fucosyltransferase family protein [Komagataeibacter xylinus]
MHPIGYDGVDLGLTNQKIALIGLIHKALRENRPFVLPSLVIYDVKLGTRERVPFADFYQVGRLLSVLQAFSIEIVQPFDFSFCKTYGDDAAPVYEEIDGWQCFLEGADRFGEVGFSGPSALNNLTCQIIRNLVPVSDMSDISKDIKHKIFNGIGIYFAVQMRIEKDWEGYSANVLESLDPFSKEEHLPTATDIINWIKKEFGSRFTAAYVLCDEKALPVPKDEIRKLAFEKHGVHLYWKSDFIDIEKENSLFLSMLDFELAIEARYFIGTSRSTFSCFVSFEKFCKTRKNIDGHYIYNTSSNKILERHDNGTFMAPDKAIDRLYQRHPLFPRDEKDIDLPMSLHVHISNIGEYESRNNEIRGVTCGLLVAGDSGGNQPRYIEGFSIKYENTAPELYYKALHNGTWGEWSLGNNYVGTRGKSRALTGFSMDIQGPARMSLDCIYGAKFSDSDKVIIARNGEPCISVTGSGKLQAMQIMLRHKSATEIIS